MSQIGRLDAFSRSWTLAGSLKQGKRGGGVIFDGTHFMVIGGEGKGRFDNKVVTIFPNQYF